MRKILTTICALILAALFPLAAFISRGLPADTGDYAAKKYAGWSGVLQAWVCCGWSGGGSMLSWLKNRGEAFEHAHQGVYLEFILTDAETMRGMLSGGMRRPELIFFSPGVLESDAGLRTLQLPDRLRSELARDAHALPVAMGGYCWVYNRTMAEGAPVRSADLQLTIPEDGTCRYVPAAIALLSDSPDAHPLHTPEPGVDLGLPASTGAGGIAADAGALDMFIEGRLPYTIVNQAGLARLNRLREDGRGPDWACAAAGQFAWTDQLLLAALPMANGSNADAREALAAEFAAGLLAEDAQAALADAGVFPVTGEQIHAPFSAYAQMDGLLAGRPLAAAAPFSEYSRADSPAIVRDYCSGQCSAQESYAKMGLSLSLPVHPN